MKLTFDFFSIIIFLGIIQCFIISFLILIIKKGNKTANIFLSLFLISGSLSISSGILYKTNLFLYLPHLCKIGLNCQLLLGPFIYLYVKHLTSLKKKIELKSLIHFIPFIIYFLFWSKFYFSPGDNKIEYMKNWLNNNVTGSIFYIEIIWSILIFINIWIYIIKIFLLLKKHKQKITNNYSNIEKINLSWIKYLLISFISLYVTIGILIIIFLIFNIKYSVINFLIPALASLFIYTLGYNGLKQKEFFLDITKKNILKIKKVFIKEEAEFIFKRLLKYIENKKPYLKANLTLKQLSRNLMISSTKLSIIIESYFGQNFYNFINSYRIKEAIKHLQSEKYIDIDNIYRKIGFNSKILFLNIFKKITHQNPVNFRKRFLTKKNAKKFKSIGIFIDSLYDNFGLSILKGVKKTAQEEGINLICFNGGSINSPYYNYSQKTNIYNLTNINNIDGLIVISSLLGAFINKEELLSFYERFSPIPIVNIGMKMKNYPSLWINNRKGITDILTHLIEDHGYRRIAYINGPENNIDSKIRFQIYKEILNKYNIEYDPKLVASGTFIGISGKNAIETFLDKRKVHFDAVFAANDYMAIHAMKELQNRGIRVPEDIAVAGVDDITESRLLTIPLTTVSQPTYKLGYKAAKQLIHLINNETIEERIILQTGMIPRNSCGCNSTDSIILPFNKTIHKKKIIMTLKSLSEYFIPEIEYIMFSKYGGLVNPAKISSWITKLLNEIIFEIQQNQKSNFIIILKEIIEESIPKRMDIGFWKNSISFIFKTILSILKNNMKKDIIKALYKQAQNLILAISRRLKEKPLLENYIQSEKLILTKQALLTVQDINSLKNVLSEELPKIGINSCYLSIYEKDNKKIITEYANLVMAYEDGKIINYNPNNTRFPSDNLTPNGLNKINDNTYILMSLYYADRKIGFIIFEINLEHAASLEILVLDINNTLNRIELHKEIKNHDISKKHIKVKQIKYEKSGLTKKMSEEYYEKLLKFLKIEKVYINPDLTLPLLAKKLNITRNHLSHIINNNSGLNFFDFINSYRIKEAKIILDKYKEKKINILEVAHNSGFKSKSTFNKLFKKYINMTPSQYKKK